MPVTVKDIADLAGVSVATVSRVTNEAANVSCETRERVLSAIARLQYRPNPSAAQLARRSNGISRNAKSRRPGSESTSPRLSPAWEMNFAEHRHRTDRMRLLERENLQLKRQVSSLIADLEKWKESLKRKLGT